MEIRYNLRSTEKRRRNVNPDFSPLSISANQQQMDSPTQSRKDPDAGPIQVHVNVQLFRLLHIDEATETVTLDLGFTFMWEDPHVAAMQCKVNFSTHPSITRLKTTEYHTIGEVTEWPADYQPGIGAFDPAWKIADCYESEIVASVTQVIDPKTGLVHNFTHMIAKIHQPLHLRSFPFDTQNFKFIIRTEHLVNVMRFVQFTNGRAPKIYNHDASEWIIRDGMQLSFNLVDVSTSAAAKDYCHMAFHITVKRKPEWYLSNVILVSWMIVSASFSVFFISEESMAERLGIIFTTWLLLISLKFVIADRIPKIAYLTILDSYLLYSYAFMMLLVVHACVQKKLTWDSVSEQYCMEMSRKCLKFYGIAVLVWIENLTELYVMIFFLLLWSLGHIAIAYNYCYDYFKDYFVLIDYCSFLWAPFTYRRGALSAKLAKARMGDTVDDVMIAVRNRSKNDTS